MHDITGSKKAKEVLSLVYNVDLIKIPNLFHKQYIEFQIKTSSDENNWLNEISTAAIFEARKERGILIICETIENSKRIAGKLKENYRAGAIKLYIMNDMNQEREIEKIYPGQIFIATNLAGRGTDIKTDEIEKFGGLHVIITFMPSNQRVEEQAFGRTARQGKCGTGQMILNSLSLSQFDQRDGSTKEVKLLRDEFEIESLNHFQKKELKVIEKKDELFNKFCVLLNKIRRDIRDNCEMWKMVKDGLKGLATNISPTVFETQTIAAVEEQWALFLRKIDDEDIKLEDSISKYNEFEYKIWQDYKKDQVIKNPYYHIVIGNDFVINKKYEKALKHFCNAIDIDKQFSSAAYVGKAWCLLCLKNNDYKTNASIEFQAAMKLLNDEMASLNAVQAILQLQNQNIKSELSRQLIQKINILGSYVNSVQKCIMTIKKSKRLIDINAIKTKNDHLAQTDNLDKAFESKTYTYFKDNERNIQKRIDKNFNDFDEFEVTFKDLTQREDTVNIDQAVNTIYNGFPSKSNFELIVGFFSKNLLNSNKYNGLGVYIKQITSEKLKTILDYDIEIKEATKEVAITQLKDKSSFFHRNLLPDSWSPDSYKINFEIKLDGQREEFHEKIQVKDALKIIETKTNKNLSYNIKFLSANENAKLIRSDVLKRSIFNAEFEQLTSEDALSKLNQIKFKYCDIEISGTKEELFSAISQSNVKMVQFYGLDQEGSEIVEVNKAKSKINEIKNNFLRIKNLDSVSAKEILSLCKNSFFCLEFFDISISESLDVFNENQSNVCFDQIDQIDSKKLISVLRKENLEFEIRFKHLNLSQFENVIYNADLDQEDIEITTVRNLKELFMNEARPTLELDEFAAKGIEYILEINEKRFIPWISIISVGALAFIQMGIGGVLIMTGFGATVGMGLITEGAADLFTAYRAYSNRQFTWSDYIKQKAVSYAISIVSMGWGKIKDAGKGLSNVFSGVSTEVLEQSGTQILVNGKAASKTLIESGKSLKSLAFTQIGVKTTETAMREVLNKGVDSFSNFAMDQFKPQISAQIQNKVKSRFFNSNLLLLVRKMYALESILKSTNLKDRIDRIVSDTINPEHNFWRKQWESIGGPLCKGILSDQKFLGSPFSMGMRILGTLNGLYQITFIIDSIHDQLIKKLAQLDQESFNFTQLIHQNCQIEKKDSRDIVDMLKENHIIQVIANNQNGSILEFEYLEQTAFRNNNSKSEFITAEDRNHKKAEIHLEKLDFLKHSKYKVRVNNFLEKFNEEYQNINFEDTSEIMKSVSDAITIQIIRITESQLISPWSSYGMGKLTEIVSNGVQNKIIQSGICKDIKSIEDQIKDLESKDNKSAEDNNKLSELYGEFSEKFKLSKEKLNYTDLINHEAKKYTVAYSQCETIHKSKQRNSNKISSDGAPSERVKTHAEGARNNKPADLVDMFNMATENGINIKLVDDPNYKMTEEEKANDTKIVVFSKGEVDKYGNEGIGHYQLLKDDQLINISTDNNNCGYAVISEILKEKGVDKSIDQLRNENANTIIENSVDFNKALEAQEWIQTRYPQEAKTFLFTGGAERSKRDLNDSKIFNDYDKLSGELQDLIKKPEFESLDENSKAAIKNLIHDLLLVISKKEELTGRAIKHKLSSGREIEINKKEGLKVFNISIQAQLEYISKKINENPVIAANINHPISKSIGNLASVWSNRVPGGMIPLAFGQKQVSENFQTKNKNSESAIGSSRIQDIAEKDVEKDGKAFVEKYGPAAGPINVAVIKEKGKSKAVAMNNRMLVAHVKAGEKPIRFIPVIPTNDELNRLEENPNLNLPGKDSYIQKNLPGGKSKLEKVSLPKNFFI